MRPSAAAGVIVVFARVLFHVLLTGNADLVWLLLSGFFKARVETIKVRKACSSI